MTENLLEMLYKIVDVICYRSTLIPYCVGTLKYSTGNNLMHLTKKKNKIWKHVKLRNNIVYVTQLDHLKSPC